MAERVFVCGVPFDNCSEKEFLATVCSFVSDGNQHFVVTPNPEFVVEGRKNKEFVKILSQADYSIADGIGILWAATFLSLPVLKNAFLRLFVVLFQAFFTLFMGVFSKKGWKKVLKTRITGVDMFQELCKLSAKKGWKVFFLGASEGVADQVKGILEKKYAGLHICGTYAGTPLSDDEEEICKRIDRVSPDILFVAYGAPHQEFWIKRNLKKMSSVKFSMGIGGSFDFVAGKQKRAPKMMRKMGLEWLYRLFTEPRRIKRIYNATFVFFWIVVRYKLIFREKLTSFS